RCRRARDIQAVCRLEDLVRSARVADQAEPVGADRDRGVDVGDALDRGDGRRRAGDVRAMGDFELVEPGVADQGEPVRSDRDRAVAAREVAVERRSLEAGAIEADAAGARRPLWPGLPLRPGIALKALWPCDAGRADESSGPTWPDPTSEATRPPRPAKEPILGRRLRSRPRRPSSSERTRDERDHQGRARACECDSSHHGQRARKYGMQKTFEQWTTWR